MSVQPWALRMSGAVESHKSGAISGETHARGMADSHGAAALLNDQPPPGTSGPTPGRGRTERQESGSPGPHLHPGERRHKVLPANR